MPSSRSGRVPSALILAVVLSTFALGSRAAPPTPERPKTTFLPSRDMLFVPNASGRGTASGGSCHGLVEAALVYKALRDKSGGKLPPLGEVKNEIEDRFGLDRADQILRGLAVAEQHHVYQQTIQLIQTDQGKRTVFENLKTSLDAGQPVRLSLLAEDGAGHIVVAFDYTRDADGDFVFKVGDPNRPGDDGLTITYVLGDPQAPMDSDARRGTFEVYGSRTRPFEVYGVQAPLERQPERLVELIQEARDGATPRSDFVPPPGLELREEEQATGVADPEVGGVLLRFPSSWYGERLSDAEYDRVVRELRGFLRHPRREGVVVWRDERSEDLVLVPVSELVATAATTVGPLTRVRGWVIAQGQLQLVGEVEPGRPAIPLALLTEALSLVWRKGLSPWVSLDPDPDDPFGVQRARVGGVSDALRDGVLVRSMLAADYVMKELILGARATSVAEFRSIRELIRAGVGASQDEVLFRLWLVPLSAPGADVLVTREGGDHAVWFDSAVQVLTENMVRRGGMLVGTGSRDPVGEATASDFTRHFSALARENPTLARLARVFELAKLAALMRAMGVDDPVLTQLASRLELSAPPELDEPTPPWRGIGPLPVEGTDRVIGGGAHAKVRARRGLGTPTDRLAPLLLAARRAERGPIGVTLPAVVDLEAAAAHAATADLSLREAQARAREGDAAGALPYLDRVLDFDPDDVEALAMRALLRRASRAPGALEDAERAAALEPRLEALRAMLEAESPDRARVQRALVSVDETAARFHDDGEVQLMATLAHLAAADLDGARARFAALSLVAPFEDATRHLDGLLSLLIDGPLTRDEAKSRLLLMRDVPLDIQQQVKLGADTIDRDPVEAVRRLDGALALAEASEVPAVRALFVPERVRFMRALARYKALGQGAEPEGRDGVLAALRADADALVTAHPDWAGGQVAHMLASDASGEAEAEVAAWLSSALAREGRDPILVELGVVLDTDQPTLLLGLMTAWGRAIGTPGAGRRLMTLCAEALGERPMAPMLRALLAEPDLHLPSFLERRSSHVAIPESELESALVSLRKVIAAAPEDVGRDALAWWLLPLVFKAYLPLEQERGDPARLVTAGPRYLRATRLITARSPFSSTVLELRAATAMLVAAAIGELATASMRRDGAGLEAHARALEGARPDDDPTQIRAHLDALAEGMAALVADSRRGVAVALADVEAAEPAARQLVALVLALQQRAMGERALPEDLLARLRAIPGIADSRELARLLEASAAAQAGLFVTESPQHLVSEVARLAASNRVTAETAVRALEQLSGFLASEGRDARLGDDVEQVVAQLRARVKLGAFAAPGVGDTSGAQGPPSGAAPWSVIAIALGSGLALALGAWLIIRRRATRERRGATGV